MNASVGQEQLRGRGCAMGRIRVNPVYLCRRSDRTEDGDPWSRPQRENYSAHARLIGPPSQPSPADQGVTLTALCAVGATFTALVRTYVATFVPRTTLVAETLPVL